MKKLLISIIILQFFGVFAAGAHAASPKNVAIDLAPFALPRTAANEVRFEEPRDIREVTVTLKTAEPNDLGLSYLHRTWRKERQELLEPTLHTFQLGWKHVDDWFSATWEKAAVRAERTGRRMAVQRFEPLSK